MDTIIGRKKELMALEEIYRSGEAELLAIYGRRRVGKTYLISQFFKDKGLYFEVTGTKDAPLHEQMINFAAEVARVFHGGERVSPPKDWTEALARLHEELERKGDGEKHILFFDELPWLASPRSGFLQALDHFWNRHLSRRKNTIMIICGSLASWMIENVIHSKGGLHGRVTRKIRLLPFGLAEAEELLQSRGVDLERKQISELYMALGGVPQYLKYAERGKSAAQIINDTCFSPSGFLFDEFEKLYRSLYDHHRIHTQFIKALAKAHSGLGTDALLKKVGMKSGGTASSILESLEEAGFISYLPTFGRKKVGGKYRLMDEYSLFYLTWIAGMSRTSLEGVDENYWVKKTSSRAWPAWSGCAFETLCLKHVHKIKEALGIAGVSTAESAWSSAPQGRGEPGAQIDLVIDRADSCINLCEMKYAGSEFAIDKKYAKELEAKKDIFRRQTGTKKTLFTTMVTTYGVKKNQYAASAVDSELTLDDLFR